MKRITLTLIATLFLCSCKGFDYSTCEFQPGEMVRSKISQDIGQVIRIEKAYKKNWCYSDVRFPGEQEATTAHVLGSGGPIIVRSLTTVTYMRPYELEYVK